MTPLRIALFAMLWLLLGIWGLVGGNLLFGFGGEPAWKGLLAILIILFWSGLALWIAYRRIGKEG